MHPAATPVTSGNSFVLDQIRQTAGNINRAVDSAVAEPCRVFGPEVLVNADVVLVLVLDIRRGIEGIAVGRGI